VIPARKFYDGSINYYAIDRLGGVLSHLNKILQSDLVRVLGADHPVITTMELSGSQLQDLSKLQTFLCCLWLLQVKYIHYYKIISKELFVLHKL
jgi:hypothetical protein